MVKLHNDFQIGDAVEVKTIEEMRDEFGELCYVPCGFIGSDMGYLCGQVLHIKAMREMHDDDYTFDECAIFESEEGTEGSWTLDTSMIKHYDEDLGNDPIPDEDFLALLELGGDAK